MSDQKVQRDETGSSQESAAEVQRDLLAVDNHRMRVAGCELAAAALHVICAYDGIHRLALAVSGWCQAIAAEGGRPHDAPTPQREEQR